MTEMEKMAKGYLWGDTETILLLHRKSGRLSA